MKNPKRYVKKPIEIEAIQYTGDNLTEVKAFADGSPMSGLVNHSDWLIKGIQGEYYPCSNAIFELTYNEVKSNEK